MPTLYEIYQRIKTPVKQKGSLVAGIRDFINKDYEIVREDLSEETWEDFREIIRNNPYPNISGILEMTRKAIISEPYYIASLERNSMYSANYNSHPVYNGPKNKLTSWARSLFRATDSSDEHRDIANILLCSYVFLENTFNGIRDLFGDLSEEEAKETIVYVLLGVTMKNKLSSSLAAGLSLCLFESELIQNIFIKDTGSFIKILEEEHGVSLENFTPALNRYFQGINHVTQMKKASEYGRVHFADFRELSGFSDIDMIEKDELKTAYKVSSLIYRHSIFSPISGLVSSLHKYLQEKVDWDSEDLNQIFNNRIEAKKHDVIEQSELIAIEKLFNKDRITPEFFETFWNYAILHWNDIIKKLLRKMCRKFSDGSTKFALREKLLSGFPPPPIPTNHNPYRGLHHSQLRPYFQLLKSVTDVDIIKFYQTVSELRVRFILKGEIYDILTGEGFGEDIHSVFNTILFENGVPYQFVTFHNSATGGIFKNSSYHKWGFNVTLINQSEELTLNPHITKQDFAGFARTVEPVPKINLHISELKKMRLRPDLDEIDLLTDAKFSSIVENIKKLKPQETWQKIIIHLMKHPTESKSSKTWQKQLRLQFDDLPTGSFPGSLALLIDGMIKNYEWFNDTEKLAGLRGVAYACRIEATEAIIYRLQQIANKAYKKVTGGPLSTKLGNIALESLATIGNIDAYGALVNMKSKTKYSVYIRAIERTMKKFDTLLSKYSAEDLEDLSVPTFQLENGVRRIQVGTYHAILRPEGLKIVIKWESEVGKITKSVPASIKKTHAIYIKEVKATAKSIDETLNAQARRMENTWLKPRKWSAESWGKYFQNHPLMSILSSKLIWTIEEDGKKDSFILSDGKSINAAEKEVMIGEEAVISLWHPAIAETNEVLAWRNFLFAKTIKQPIKQGFREVYILTPAEELTGTFSNRFQGHHLHGNTLYSLGKTRGWKVSYEESPYLILEKAGIVATFGIMGRVLYSNCMTRSLHFAKIIEKRKSSLNPRTEPMELVDVPPIILSEVMRDADLFVAVSSQGLDPYINQNEEGDLLNYWRDMSFGEKSKSSTAALRKDLLERLLPMTTLADKYNIEDNFLVITGKIHTYKINLGSSNILRSPNDQYLCIVPGTRQKTKQVWLPFEGGDKVLMTILSKAFMLADDDKITDASITRQL